MSEPTCPRPPLVAILRGLEAERAVEVARVLFDAGFRIVEVPLNRPGAIDGIAAIARSAPTTTGRKSVAPPIGAEPCFGPAWP